MVTILDKDPRRVTAHVLRHKDLASLQAYAARDFRGSHMGCVKVWRWETAISKCFNANKCYGTTLQGIEACGQGILTVWGTYSGQQKVGELWFCVHVHEFMFVAGLFSIKFI